MAPLIILLVVGAATRVVGAWTGLAWLNGWTPAVVAGLAALFVSTSIAHFVSPKREQLRQMVPPGYGNPSTMVALTGVLEAAGAVGLIVPPTSRLAAGCLGLLLIAMFPANVRAAREGLGVKTMPLVARALVQAVFVAACCLVAFGPPM